MRIIVIWRMKNEREKVINYLEEAFAPGRFDGVGAAFNDCTDGSAVAAQDWLTAHNVPYLLTPTHGFDMGRDENAALDNARQLNPDWICYLDTDEQFELAAWEPGPNNLRDFLANAPDDVGAVCFRVYPFWMFTNKYRVDGPWRKFPELGQARLFRANAIGRFKDVKAHCGFPDILQGFRAKRCKLRIKHFVVISQEEAQRKHARLAGNQPHRDFSHVLNDFKAIYKPWIEDVEQDKWT